MRGRNRALAEAEPVELAVEGAAAHTEKLSRRLLVATGLLKNATDVLPLRVGKKRTLMAVRDIGPAVRRVRGSPGARNAAEG